MLARGLVIVVFVEISLWGVLAHQNGYGLVEAVQSYEAAAALLGLTLAVVGSVVVSIQPRHALGWLFLGAAQAFGLSDLAAQYGQASPRLPGATVAGWVGVSIWAPAWAALIALVALLFPDGRPPSPRWRGLVWLAVGLVGLGSTALLLSDRLRTPEADDPAPPWLPDGWGAILQVVAEACILGALGCGVVGAALLLVRMIGTRGPERRRIGWFFLCFGVLVGAYLLPVPRVVQLMAIAVIPVALGMAMVRHRLFAADRLLSRTLVYTTLTIAIVTVFALAVGFASDALGSSSTGAVVAAAAIALGLSPARAAVQRGVDRLLYGHRRDPYRALAGLGRQLTAATGDDEILPSVERTIAEALHVPWVRAVGPEHPAGSDGALGRSYQIPLRYAGASVGRLVVGLGDGHQRLDPADERLLGDFGQLVAAALHGVELAEDLRRSRDELWIAREDERHRLRRDLHDDLGPALAGVALGLEAAKRAVPRASSADLLSDIEADVQACLTEIKRLAGDLPPSQLELLGLVDAVARQAAALTGRSEGRLRIQVHADQPLPPLPGTVEVAAYRIAVEALTNTARHARARRCDLTIRCDADALRLTVQDDGSGLGGSDEGIGISSMKSRAAEVGGSCLVTTQGDGGAQVVAVLPLGSPP